MYFTGDSAAGVYLSTALRGPWLMRLDDGPGLLLYPTGAGCSCAVLVCGCMAPGLMVGFVL